MLTRQNATSVGEGVTNKTQAQNSHSPYTCMIPTPDETLQPSGTNLGTLCRFSQWIHPTSAHSCPSATGHKGQPAKPWAVHTDEIS